MPEDFWFNLIPDNHFFCFFVVNIEINAYICERYRVNPD